MTRVVPAIRIKGGSERGRKPSIWSRLDVENLSGSEIRCAAVLLVAAAWLFVFRFGGL